MSSTDHILLIFRTLMVYLIFFYLEGNVNSLIEQERMIDINLGLSSLKMTEMEVDFYF